MKHAPIVPARIEFVAGEPPRAPLFGDLYHPRIGAFEQARHVFLAGNQLPQRWADRQRFAILETGFGLGNNFLATWAAWRADPQRCRQLVFVSIEAHPPTLGDLQRCHAASPLMPLAQALLAAWPPAVPGLHLIDLDGGNVQLLLVWGDIAACLPQLRGPFDAFYLDGFAPARNPAMWQPRVLKALGRLAQAEATLATWSVARSLRDGLLTAGFPSQRTAGIGGKLEVLQASFAPRPGAHRRPVAPPVRNVLVIGAGLAGAWAAQALARKGLRVTVLERQASVAAETSGNPGGLWHGALHADDGPHARLHRAAALLASRRLPEHVSGLLRVETRLDLAPMQALLERLGLPPDYVQAVSAAQAAELAGVSIAAPAWFYRSGGWLDPAALVRRLLAAPDIRVQLDCSASSLHRVGDRWIVQAGGQPFDADAVVLANGADTQRLLPADADTAWPLDSVRGQVSWCRPEHAPGTSPRIPVSGDGYALRLADGRLLFGASSHAGDGEASARASDHQFNLGRLLRLTGLAPGDASCCDGRVGWRLQTPDRLPIVGAVVARAGDGGGTIDRSRQGPRMPGLYVSTAFGARGIAMAALAAELLAAQVSGSPWPLEADLAAAIDPARWRLRAARRGQRGVDGSAAG